MNWLAGKGEDHLRWMIHGIVGAMKAGSLADIMKKRLRPTDSGGLEIVELLLSGGKDG